MSLLFNAVAGLGFLLLPDLLFFQTLVPCVSTVGLLTNLLDPQPFELFLLGLSFCLAISLELALYLISLILAREHVSPLDLLVIIPQRIIYGFVCVYLTYRALVIAFLGVRVGWNKLDRVGNVEDIV